MSLENAQKAIELAAKRKRIAAAKWNAVIHDPQHQPGVNFGTATRDTDKADEQLQWAIEEFRSRKLAQIDADLRELGFEPPKAEPRSKRRAAGNGQDPRHSPAPEYRIVRGRTTAEREAA